MYRHLHSTAPRGRGILGGLLQTASTNNPVTSQWSGQPLHRTHPHLVSKAQLTPGLTPQEYESRRQQLVSQLPDNALAVSFGAQQQFSAPHVFYGFRQNADFHYLTGWNEPGAALVLEKSRTSERGYTMTLFARAKDPQGEVWEGPRNGLEAAVDLFGADEAWPLDEFQGRVQKRLTGREPPVYVDLESEHGVEKTKECAQLRLWLKRQRMGGQIRRLTTLVQQQRLVKSPAEIGLLKTAGRASSLAFQQMLRACQPGISESLLQSHLEHAFKTSMPGQAALIRPAYVPVFAAGDHALCMHYVQNSGTLREGDLVLVDAGAEYAGYCSDISRTFPISGRWSPAQRDLYSVVLSVQRQMIGLCNREAGYSLNEIHRKSTHLMRTELKQIGFDASEHYIDRHLYPHHISHYLGMDLHDTLDISRSQMLKPNMVVTIEPGLYVPYDSRFPRAFQGMGIRIEDDVVVGSTGGDTVNLTELAPKTLEAIEEIY